MTNLETAPIAHNNLIDLARSSFHALGAWLTDNPVINDEDTARAAKTWKDRAESMLRDLDDERDARTAPYKDTIATINGEYSPWHSKSKPGLWDKVLVELKQRMTAYALAEEARRFAAAEAARRLAEAAEAAARAAEAKEFEALADAKQGVVTDVHSATAAADTAFAEFERASRFAARADRDTKVRLADGAGRAATLRTKETLTVVDWRVAIEAIGLTDKIADAIVAGAREHRKITGSLPPGIERTVERAI